MKNRLILIAIFSIFTSYSAFSKNKQWSCINEKGQTVFTIEAMQVYDFHNGLAKIYKNTLINNAWITGYGYINRQGEVVIPCNLKEADNFVGDYTWVKFTNDNNYTLLHKTGTIIPTKGYNKVGSFFDFQTDICAVYEDGKMGFIDITGQEVISCKYSGLSSFSNGLASVCLYDSEVNKYGYINKKGEVIISMKYRQTGPSSFDNGLARVSVNGQTVLIDTVGKIVFKTSHGNIQGVSGNLISVFKNSDRTNWGWVNFKDEIIIPQKYEAARRFNKDGLAIVELNGLKGVINTTGKIVIPIKYETVYCNSTDDGFIMGVFPSKEVESLISSKKEYYDKNFNLLKLEQIGYIKHAIKTAYMPFYQNGKWGYLNRDFSVLIPATYKKVNLFHEGLAFVRQ